MARAAAAFALEARASTAPMSADEMIEALRRFDVIVATLGDAFSEEIFARAEAAGPIRCRLLANFGVGYNHIDAAAAARRGILVTNTPGAVTDATADIAIALMLMSTRRAAEGERLVRSGRWQGWHPTQMLGLHVTGKTIGIIGMGRIGKAIARRAHYGFLMRVVFANRSPLADPGVPGARQLGIDEVMATADVIAVAVPGGPATRHLIDARRIALMRPHAHLINISRGDVIDEAALIEALEAKRIGGAGLDVYEHEPEVPARLRALDNAVLLPHLGTAALEVRTAMGMMALDNVEAFLAGRRPPNPVPEAAELAAALPG
ncbi:MAG: D-glycerate dehydrogenase [Alphaproteobacteria bacterium]|nr:MAG: D-glycerate dehydrogenase [Alphaproteobacteria bacterium]